jgi:hypothetical protein
MNFVRVVLSISFLLFLSAHGCSDDSTSVSTPKYSERSDSTFAVGDSSALEIGNFAGKVTVKPANPGFVHVIAEKWAGRIGDLDAIQIEMIELQNGVSISTENPSGLNNVSVDIQATVPIDTRPTVQAGAGEIDYTGQGEGECFFATGAGSITIRLPANVNIEVHLSVGAGTISVDFPIAGTVSKHIVDGIIGTGEDGKIVAQVGSGKIVIISQ